MISSSHPLFANSHFIITPDNKLFIIGSVVDLNVLLHLGQFLFYSQSDSLFSLSSLLSDESHCIYPENFDSHCCIQG